MTALVAKAKVGADIGGTFTDLVMIDRSGAIVRKKVPSTTGSYSKGILNALELAIAEAKGDAASITEFVHGTTVATNAVLELKGARVGLLTTKGFRDVLELRRLRMPVLYKLDWEKPPVLVERYLRREVTERIGADGSIVTPIDLAELECEAKWLIEQGVEALTIAFLNSYKNPAHEIAAANRLRERHPDFDISVSVEILPEMQEYERTSTAIVNAYVQPIVRAYVDLLVSTLADAGVNAPVRIMQSSGGIISAKTATRFPVQIIESGPAAGVIACQRMMKLAGYENVISFDMGGTTAKASLIESGQVKQATEYEVGGGVSQGSRLSRGGGYVIRVPSIDISEVGAGGGSLVSFDKAGGIQVGPESAGSVPGPVAYQNGNSIPTVTDANIVLGYINPSALAGGSLKIDGSFSRAAIRDQVATPLHLSSVEEAAFGIHAIANATMIRALRSVTIEQGRDPAEFVLCAFGGSGPIHAVNMARATDIRRVIVPPSPGLFSAFGLLLANIEQHASQAIQGRLFLIPPADLEEAFRKLEAVVREAVKESALEGQQYSLKRSVDLRYVGQNSALGVAIPAGELHAESIQRIAGLFNEAYKIAYGFSSENEPLELVNLRVVAEIESGVAASWLQAAASACNDPVPTEAIRNAYFGPEHGVLATPILAPSAVTTTPRSGPAIVEAYDSTIVIPPASSFYRDATGNIVIDLVY